MLILCKIDIIEIFYSDQHTSINFMILSSNKKAIFFLFYLIQTIKIICFYSHFS